MAPRTFSDTVPEDELRVYRILYLVGGVAFPLFGAIFKSINPGFYDPILMRGSVSAVFLTIFILTYTSKMVRNRINIISEIWCIIFTLYYSYLVFKNDFVFEYSVGLTIFVFGVSTAFKRSGALLFYLLITFLSAVAGYYFSENPAIAPSFNLTLLFVTMIISYLVLASRLRLLKELFDKNITLEDAYREINDQKKLVDQKNRDITDSINYAKRIQGAILPPEHNFQSFFSDSFIVYKVKDIVCGDFYWFHHTSDHVFIAAADCTGHGVPGALMSMLGSSFLNEIVREKQIYSPSDVLSTLHRYFIKTMYQNQGGEGARDGMDIAFCAMNMKNKKLVFSGAYRPLLLIRNGIIEEIEGDKHPIGGDQQSVPVFTNREIDLMHGDELCLFTDGYTDQFGGPQGKKFSKRRFRDLLLKIKDQPMSVQKSILNKTFDDWKGKLDQVDDVLVMGIRL